MFYLYFSLFNKNIHEVKNIAIRIVSYRENVYRYIPNSNECSLTLKDEWKLWACERVPLYGTIHELR